MRIMCFAENRGRFMKIKNPWVWFIILWFGSLVTTFLFTYGLKYVLRLFY